MLTHCAHDTVHNVRVDISYHVTTANPRILHFGDVLNFDAGVCSWSVTLDAHSVCSVMNRLLTVHCGGRRNVSQHSRKIISRRLQGAGWGVIGGSALGRNGSMMRTRLEWQDSRGMMRKQIINIKTTFFFKNLFFFCPKTVHGMPLQTCKHQ